MRVCCWCVALLACSCCEMEVPHRAGAAAGSAADALLLPGSFACELPEVAATCCERATTLAEWKVLRDRLGGAVATLPDAWCDFATEAVVCVATTAAAVRPGFECAVAEEEGVDVLTLTQELIPAGPARSWGIVMRTACRPAQLAVVLRRTGPAAGTGERTLCVFPGH